MLQFRRVCPARFPLARASSCTLRRTTVLRASKNDDDKPEPSSATDPAQVEKTVQELRKANVNREIAKEILQMWQTNGITDDPEELRQLYRARAAGVFGRFVIQLLFDAGACYGAYQVSQSLENDEFFGKGVVMFVFGAIAFNYAIAFLSNLFSMYLSLSSMSKFGVNASAYLEAMKTIAGTDGLDSFAKARAAVDGYKVAQALEKMDQFLKEKAAQKSSGTRSQVSTLDTLAVYLTLQKARELYGFNEQEFGITEDEATDIARVFSTYDTNDDYRLDLNEFERLCQDAGRSLTREEAKAALNVIDTDGNGYIDFAEFVRFWKNPKTQEAMPVEV